MHLNGIRAVRLTSALVAALLAFGTLAAAPAIAAPAHRTTTFYGTVTAVDGRHLAGIRVTAGPADLYEGPAADRDAMRTVTTSVSGRYTVRITAGSALVMKFEDPTDRYFGASKARFSAKAGTVHRVDRVLTRVSQIAGTVRDTAGHPLRHAIVRVYDAVTGKRSPGTAMTDSKGRFHLLVHAGRYKVRFSHDGVRAEWFGDATARKSSPTVSVGTGAKRAGVNAVLG